MVLYVHSYVLAEKDAVYADSKWTGGVAYKAPGSL